MVELALSLLAVLSVALVAGLMDRYIPDAWLDRVFGGWL